jgi:hypothetical protein
MGGVDTRQAETESKWLTREGHDGGDSRAAAPAVVIGRSVVLSTCSVALGSEVGAEF